MGSFQGHDSLLHGAECGPQEAVPAKARQQGCYRTPTAPWRLGCRAIQATNARHGLRGTARCRKASLGQYISIGPLPPVSPLVTANTHEALL